MTHHDLSVLVRDHVASHEPTFTSPDEVIARGRRRVRTRRFTTGGVAALVAVVAMGGALAMGSGDEPSRSDSTSIDPATQQALEDYDARAMPDLLDREARAVLDRSVPALDDGEFRAEDGSGATLPPEYYDKASGMSISYGGVTAHRLSVELRHAKSEAEGDAQEYCDNGLAEGIYLECTVDIRAEGAVTSKLWAMRPDGRRSSIVVRKDELSTVNPDRLWFEHSVKVIKSETFVTYVDERVKAPTQEAAQALFTVPVADLVELGLNPRLVIPPVDPERGCPWMLATLSVTCGVALPEVSRPDAG